MPYERLVASLELMEEVVQSLQYRCGYLQLKAQGLGCHFLILLHEEYHLP